MNRRRIASAVVLAACFLVFAVPAHAENTEPWPHYSPDYALTGEGQRLEEEKRQFDLMYEAMLRDIAAQEAAAQEAAQAAEKIEQLELLITIQDAQIEDLEARTNTLWGDISKSAETQEAMQADTSALTEERDALLNKVAVERWVFAGIGALVAMVLVGGGAAIWSLARRSTRRSQPLVAGAGVDPVTTED